jgi:hypothetical protein
VQSTLDAGSTWFDIAAVAFATASAKRAFTVGPFISGGTAMITPVTAALTSNTEVPGLLGDRLRVQYISTGTYAGDTTLAVDAVVKN